MDWSKWKGPPPFLVMRPDTVARINAEAKKEMQRITTKLRQRIDVWAFYGPEALAEFDRTGELTHGKARSTPEVSPEADKGHA